LARSKSASDVDDASHNAAINLVANAVSVDFEVFGDEGHSGITQGTTPRKVRFPAATIFGDWRPAKSAAWGCCAQCTEPGPSGSFGRDLLSSMRNERRSSLSALWLTFVEIDAYGEGCNRWQVLVTRECRQLPEDDVAPLRGMGSSQRWRRRE